MSLHKTALKVRLNGRYGDLIGWWRRDLSHVVFKMSLTLRCSVFKSALNRITWNAQAVYTCASIETDIIAVDMHVHVSSAYMHVLVSSDSCSVAYLEPCQAAFSDRIADHAIKVQRNYALACRGGC